MSEPFGSMPCRKGEELDEEDGEQSRHDFGDRPTLLMMSRRNRHT
jgi:hypothetical protein